ncbi:MAG: hypothetical protein E2O68_07145 [Deltaproteobacteria bacterium]|nr:MAG: hypothetical protein E2O68_07145 [Deltaproteobacteria bacterium]
MKLQSISKAYAKSITELAEEKKIDIAGELTDFNVLINENNNLETLLFSDVFSVEEKTSVLKFIFEKSKVSDLFRNFIYFLLNEKRMGIFPMIFKDVIVIDDDKKGFLRGTIEGSEATVNIELMEKIKAYLVKKIGKNTELEYVQSKKITAGYRVTVEDLQLDASLDNQLEVFKESVLT